MKSDRFAVDQRPEHEKKALHEIERLAEYKGLDREDAMTLRLLAEEMIGMAKGVLDYVSGQMWMETRGATYEIHLLVKNPIDIDEQAALLSVAKNGENAFAKGIGGKIRQMFEDMLIASNTVDLHSPDIVYEMGDDGSISFNRSWSMRSYVNAINKTERREEWDGLEKSIIVAKADDVIVGVRSNEAEMIAVKTFVTP